MIRVHSTTPMRLVLGCGVVVVLPAVNAASASRHDTPAALSVAELRAEIRATQESIHSLYVESCCAYADNGKFPVGSAIYRTVAFKQPRSFFCSSAKGHANLDWRDDPRWQRWYVNDVRTCQEFVRWRAYRDEKNEPKGRLPEVTHSELFFLATGIWPFNDTASPKFPEEQDASLAAVVNDDRYVMRATPEKCNERLCFVLEGPGDILWIDLARGAALAAREIRRKADGAPISRFELVDHFEISPGVWFPRAIHNMQYELNALTGESRLIVDADIRVLVAHANDVTDDVFRFRPPPGALRLNAGASTMPVQTRPGGLDHLDDLVSWLFRAGLGPRRRTHDLSAAVVAFIAGVSVALIGNRSRGRYRARSAGGTAAHH